MCLTTGMMSKALEQGVSDLELCIYMPLMYEPPRLLPDTVFINNTLVKLTLGTELCLGRSPWENVDLPLLKSLFLHTVWFSNHAICDVMMDGCPQLEELYIHHIYIEEARLDLAFARAGRWGDEHDTCLKIMNSITNVQILYLSCFTVEVMYECLDLDEIPLFKNLATLHFEGNKKEYWQLLCNMIEKSPKLETLVLEGLCGISDCGVGIDGGNMVKVVEIQEYKGRLEELNQVKCFLREMENLEEMKVNTSDEIENKLQLTNDLLALLPKRSSKCNIHVL
ncbi:unnamed protein product [Arabidopsis thaliana]|uniref:FBD domain-containing protein n=1 Tax=Arabidopsis thaliana TaxID=3702 RepID=A0A5S9YA36_ARATH|nr:unnamed protein product [Arabidopsis thaliana]